MSGIPPENIKKGDDGEFRPNPTWFTGDGWGFRPARGGPYPLRLDAGGESVKIELTPEQASVLFYSGLMGELEEYGK